MTPLDVLHAVAQGEGEFLRRGRAGFADVVAGDRDAVPSRHVLRLELDRVDDELHRRFRRIDELVLRVEFLEDVVLQRAAELGPVEPALLRHREVHRPDDSGGAVDRLADGDVFKRDVRVETMHVLDGVDRDAAAPDFTGGERVVGIATHERWKVEGGGEAGVGLRALGVFQQVLEAGVGVVGGAEAGELAHGPQPCAIHAFVDAAGERELARVGDAWVRGVGPVGSLGRDGIGAVEAVHRVSRDRDGFRIDLGGRDGRIRIGRGGHRGWFVCSVVHGPEARSGEPGPVRSASPMSMIGTKTGRRNGRRPAGVRSSVGRRVAGQLS